MPREPIVRETAEKLIADCHKSPTAASAKASYNAGWSLYFALNDKEEREIAEGLESSYQLFAAAVPIFEDMKMGLEAGKARVGHSMLGGTLNHEGVSRDSALKALEWLKPLPSTNQENCKWLMQAWRAMGESGATEEEQMAACSNGLSVFRHLEKTWGADDRWTRYEALFYRSIGRIWARHRPKTKVSLSNAEEHLKKALDTFERIKDERS